jgi:threonine synthase
MSRFLAYSCSQCGAEHEPAAIVYRCPSCKRGVLDVQLDLKTLSKTVDPRALGDDPSLWRYGALLPIDAPSGPPTPLTTVGGTPLLAAPRSAERLGLGRVWLKDDGRLPTGSLKDRASAVVVSRAIELGVDRIATASTGNAGVALAAMARAAGLRASVFVPASAPPAKIAQLGIFGAELFLVDGNYDDAFRLCEKACDALGWYSRNTGSNPFTAEGKKTTSFEICEQLTRADDSQAGKTPWRAPDRIFVSVGDGNIISGVHKGLKELLALGWIDHMPKIMGVQAAGSAAIAHAFSAGNEDIQAVRASTIADSIAADSPSDGLRALRAATQTGGAYLTVSDEAIVAAIAALGRDATVFAEPAAAAAYAGLEQWAAAGDRNPEETIVVLITGTGLKDVATAQRATNAPLAIAPTLDALQEYLAHTEGSH